MSKLFSLQRMRDALNAKLAAQRSKRNELAASEQELRSQLEALGDTPAIEDVRSLSDRVDAVTRQQTECDDEIASILDELERCNADIAAFEENHAAAPAANGGEARTAASAAAAPVRTAPATVEGSNFRSRSRCFASRADMNAFYARSDVKEFLQSLRAMGASGRRSVSGAELTIPTVMLDMIRQNMGEYSKLIRYVRLRSVKGKARQNVMGKVPDGVWMEMAGALNELEFSFNQLETDGYKVGGYIPVDNYLLSDSDVNLGEEVLQNILHAMGRALDKAIVYGKGAPGKMPVGSVTRLAQTSQPSYWGAEQGEWTDLHSSNILKLDLASKTGESFFQPLLTAMGKADPDYSTSKRTVWCCNRATHLDLMSRALNFNAAGTLVAGMSNRMPVEGGEFVELDFLPDYEIVGGFFDLYTLVEREGASMARSEHVFFLEDKTVFKGTARYDGQPAVGEGFLAINYANTAVTTSYDFKPDYANTKLNVLVCTAAAGTGSGNTVVTVSGAKESSPKLKYAVRSSVSLKVGDKLKGSEWEDLTSGSTQIAAAAGAPITVVEVDAKDRVISAGNVAAVPAS